MVASDKKFAAVESMQPEKGKTHVDGTVANESKLTACGRMHPSTRWRQDPSSTFALTLKLKALVLVHPSCAKMQADIVVARLS